MNWSVVFWDGSIGPFSTNDMSYWVYVTPNYHNLKNDDFNYIGAYFLSILSYYLNVYLSVIHGEKKDHIYWGHGIDITSL